MAARTSRQALLKVAAVAAATFGLAVLVLSLVTGSGDERAARSAQNALPSGTPTEARIARLEAAVAAEPRSPRPLVALAGAELQYARETGDTSAYGRADRSLGRALTLKPGDAAALTERGALKAARHDFAGALRDARAARAAAPELNRPFGVLVDALVELGMYPEAARALQEMIDRRPNIDSYSRAAYLRELRGDLDGAERALRLALSAGGEVPENTAFVTALLGDLELVRGRPRAAVPHYRAGMRALPDHGPSRFGLARALAAQGDLRASLRRLRSVAAGAPSLAHSIALAEAELAAGQRAAAERNVRQADRELTQLVANGENVDLELALFEADHGSPAEAVTAGRRQWRRAPSVRSADALGWALTRAGRPREGLAYARRALALGSRDPAFLYHAGVAASRAGERQLAARLLRRVVEQAPRFSPLHGPRAARELRAAALSPEVL